MSRLKLIGFASIIMIVGFHVRMTSTHAKEINWLWEAGKDPAPKHFLLRSGETAPQGFRAIIQETGGYNGIVFPGLHLDSDRQRYLYLDADLPNCEKLLIFHRTADQDNFTPLDVQHFRLHGQTRHVILRCDMSHDARWTGRLVDLRLTFMGGKPGEQCLIRRIGSSDESLASVAGTKIEELQTVPLPEWITDKLRIDVARTPVPPIHPRKPGDWTIAMWYFGAWVPEYASDGWAQIALACPQRMPLLYDSSDPRSWHHGIMYYSNANPRVLDWHVKWMAENGVNLILFDWYPIQTPNGGIDVTRPINGGLEKGFLGKAVVGGEPVKTNRFADKIQFAVMWTNHFEAQGNPKGLIPYMCRNFFSQPNYYRIDGKPLLIVHSFSEFAKVSGGTPAGVRATLEGFRAEARAAGFPGLYVVSSEAYDGAYAKHVLSCGFDGVMQYAMGVMQKGGTREIEVSEPAGNKYKIIEEDFVTQSIPGHVKSWNDFASAVGKNYLMSMVPMIDFRPTKRPISHYLKNGTPENFRKMLQAAHKTQEARGMRKFITMYAWNEWYEGGFLEPSTSEGMAWLKQIRDEFCPREEKRSK